MLKTTFFKKDPRAFLPERATEGSVGFDLRLLDDIEITPAWVKVPFLGYHFVPEDVIAHIHTGLVARPPMACHLEIVLRSSIPRKYPGLCMPHGFGLIDEDYWGPEDELIIQVANFSDRSYTLKRGDRIAQLIFRETIYSIIEEKPYDKISTPSRGGFGSSQ